MAPRQQPVHAPTISTNVHILDSMLPSSVRVRFRLEGGIQMKTPTLAPAALVTSLLCCSWYISILVDEELAKCGRRGRGSGWCT